LIAYISEIQKYFQEHINNLNWKWQTFLSNTEKEKFYYYLCKDSDSLSERKQEYNKCIVENTILNYEDANSRNYKKLQQDVIKLEYEVQNFLDSLRGHRSNIDIS